MTAQVIQRRLYLFKLWKWASWVIKRANETQWYSILEKTNFKFLSQFLNFLYSYKNFSNFVFRNSGCLFTIAWRFLLCNAEPRHEDSDLLKFLSHFSILLVLKVLICSFLTVCNCIIGNYKIQLYWSSPHKITVWKFMYIVNPVVSTKRFPPHFFLSDMWRELYILSPEEQFISMQCRCHWCL
jgi:hypothetical protein